MQQHFLRKGEKRVEKHEGDRKGPHSTQLYPRLYYDYDTAPQAVLSRGGDEGTRGGDPCGRLSHFDCRVMGRQKTCQVRVKNIDTSDGSLYNQACQQWQAGVAQG